MDNLLAETRTKFGHVLANVKHITRHDSDARKIKIENFIGYTSIPVGLAGPLHIHEPASISKDIYVPMATTEAALIASCCRGCKALNMSGGAHFQVLSEGMSRGPVFQFNSPSDALVFARLLPSIRENIKVIAESTSRHVRLQRLTPHIIGSDVHVHFNYSCGDASGQNMVTIATQQVCEWIMKSDIASELSIQGFIIEGQLASDKKPSWGSVKEPRGMEVIAWAAIPDPVCRKVLGCTSEQLFNTQRTLQEGGIRNGQHGSNINTANIVASIFIATGQDAASTAEAAWSHLTPEYDSHSRLLTMSMYFPSLPVGVIGGGTVYDTQREGLQIMECTGPGTKTRLAGIIACYALALDASTSAAIGNNTFSQSHQRLARGRNDCHGKAKI